MKCYVYKYEYINICVVVYTYIYSFFLLSDLHRCTNTWTPWNPSVRGIMAGRLLTHQLCSTQEPIPVQQAISQAFKDKGKKPTPSEAGDKLRKSKIRLPWRWRGRAMTSQNRSRRPMFTKMWLSSLILLGRIYSTVTSITWRAAILHGGVQVNKRHPKDASEEAGENMGNLGPPVVNGLKRRFWNRGGQGISKGDLWRPQDNTNIRCIRYSNRTGLDLCLSRGGLGAGQQRLLCRFLCRTSHPALV